MAPRRLPQPRILRGEPRYRSPIPDLVICCEGEKTEPHYLEWFAKECGVPLRRDVHIIPACGVPETVLSKAITELKIKKREHAKSQTPFEVWMVIDVDEHADKMPGILLKAEKNGIHVALSNPCVEIWALYHFDPVPDAELHRKKAQSRLKELMPEYDHEKRAIFDVTMMQPLYDKAVKAARKGMENRQKERNPRGNPSTNLYELLERIWCMNPRRPEDDPRCREQSPKALPLNEKKR